MYAIIVSDLAKKQLSKISQEMKDRMGVVFERIRIRPFHFVKKLVGSPYYRLRVGDYRVILDIKEDKLIMLEIYLKFRHTKNP